MSSTLPANRAVMLACLPAAWLVPCWPPSLDLRPSATSGAAGLTAHRPGGWRGDALAPHIAACWRSLELAARRGALRHPAPASTQSVAGVLGGNASPMRARRTHGGGVPDWATSPSDNAPTGELQPAQQARYGAALPAGQRSSASRARAASRRAAGRRCRGRRNQAVFNQLRAPRPGRTDSGGGMKASARR